MAGEGMNCYMFRVRKSFVKVLIGLFVAVVFFLGLGFYFVHLYSSNVPKLTPKEEVMTVSRGERYKVTDLVNVECIGEYVLYMGILETDIATAMVDERSADEIYVGDTKGYIRVRMKGRGLKSEDGNRVEVTLIVK